MEEVKFLLYSYLEDDVNIGVIVKKIILCGLHKKYGRIIWSNLRKIRLFPKGKQS